jgi:hypothetical protein
MNISYRSVFGVFVPCPFGLRGAAPRPGPHRSATQWRSLCLLFHHSHHSLLLVKLVLGARPALDADARVPSCSTSRVRLISFLR